MFRVLFAVNCLNCLFISVQAQDFPGVPGERLTYVDKFNDPADFQWGMFEEIVEGNDCYKENVGLVARTEDTKRGRRGGGLMVSSNYNGAVLGSNHVLATRTLTDDRGVPGRFSYRTFFYVDPEILGGTQTGPELSIQNTFPIGLDESGNQIWRTNIGALQYVGYAQSWNIWTKPDSNADTKKVVPEQAVWMPVAGPALDEKGWWKIRYVMKFNKKKRGSKYIKYVITSPSCIETAMDLRGFRIAQEARGWVEGSLFATLEAQNLYVDCAVLTEANTHDAYYDDVVIVTAKNSTVPENPTLEKITQSVPLGASKTLTLAENLAIVVLQDPPVGGLVVAGNTLTYTAPEAPVDQFGIKYKACDTDTFLCAEDWWVITVENLHKPQAPAEVPLETASAESCGALIDVVNPITDDDGNIDWSLTEMVSDAGGRAGVGEEGFFTFDVPSSPTGLLGFQVKVCDPYDCAWTWIEVTWSC